jgi:3-oxoacyl-(acyl-carrier-protein) synthase/acyl carrier protein
MKNSFDDDVAVVGIACDFPGASTKDEYWNLLSGGKSGITLAPDNRRTSARIFKREMIKAGLSYELNGGFINSFDKFDSEFFTIPPREAKHIDPQQRILLQLVWHALEDAYINPLSLSETATGVFIGVMGNEWGGVHMNLLDQIDRYTGTGNGYCLTANRISYYYNLHGPSIAIDTACSSSLVAVDRARNSLLMNESDCAVVGGVNFLYSPCLSIFYAKAGLLAQDGSCKPFSKYADGIGRGEGAGVVILKRLSDALNNKDRIYAVIKGSAVNHNGQSNGIMAPSRQGQEKVIRSAYTNAGVDLTAVSFIEAHGSGTIIGDPIEFSALKSVVGAHRDKADPCRVGSVKGNVGHLEGAAGIAGFIKTALCIYNRATVPSLHSNEINEYINFDNSGLTIPQEYHEFKCSADELYAGVSSFGLGGANCHVVLCGVEKQKIEPSMQPIKDYYFVKASAKTNDALVRSIKDLYEMILPFSDEELGFFSEKNNLSKPDLAKRVSFSGDRNNLIKQIESYIKCGKFESSVLRNEYTYLQLAYNRGDKVDWNHYYPVKSLWYGDLTSYPFSKDEFVFTDDSYKIYSLEETSSAPAVEDAVYPIVDEYEGIIIEELAVVTEIHPGKFSKETHFKEDVKLDSLMLLDFQVALSKRIESAKHLNIENISSVERVVDLANMLRHGLPS